MTSLVSILNYFKCLEILEFTKTSPEKYIIKTLYEKKHGQECQPLTILILKFIPKTLQVYPN